jgi:hypothetical protein
MRDSWIDDMINGYATSEIARVSTSLESLTCKSQAENNDTMVQASDEVK